MPPPHCGQPSPGHLCPGIFYAKLQRGPVDLIGPTDEHPAASSAAHRRERHRPTEAATSLLTRRYGELPPSSSCLVCLAIDERTFTIEVGAPHRRGQRQLPRVRCAQ
jgi:hypothetical protein